MCGDGKDLLDGLDVLRWERLWCVTSAYRTPGCILAHAFYAPRSFAACPRCHVPTPPINSTLPQYPLPTPNILHQQRLLPLNHIPRAHPTNLSPISISTLIPLAKFTSSFLSPTQVFIIAFFLAAGPSLDLDPLCTQDAARMTSWQQELQSRSWVGVYSVSLVWASEGGEEGRARGGGEGWG